MKRLLLFLLLWPLVAHAHVGSPDVFFEGDAGPYHLFVSIRVPQVIPGVATIEIRASSPDVQGVTVVPMRLSGPGSELPPTPDTATRAPGDPQFFTADLWLMEHGSLQVRVAVTGARGSGTLRIPVPAAALKTRGMDRGLGLVLFGLMLLLAFGAVGIATGAVRDAALEPGASADAGGARRARIAMVVAGAGVAGILALGNWWWSLEARTYESFVQKPWIVQPRVDNCTISIPVDARTQLLPDHGHDMHLFLVRMPGMDQLAHLHPSRDGGEFSGALPSLPAGHYKLFADIVLASGFPVTGSADLDLSELHCAPLAGDDTSWAAGPPGDVHIAFDRPAEVRAGHALPLKFHVDVPKLGTYMGMAGHAEIVKTDATVFAHIHPTGSVAMPALEMVQGNTMMMDMPDMDMPPDVSFPYGFPSPGDYRVFVQVKARGAIVTGAFDVEVK
jgi:uncharacterized membrane protein YwzB